MLDSIAVMVIVAIIAFIFGALAASAVVTDRFYLNCSAMGSTMLNQKVIECKVKENAQKDR